MEKICAGVVTYNPEHDLLKKNIESICHQVEHIIIVDNGSTNKKEWIQIVESDEITVVWNDSNKGIATALNQLCGIAYEKGYKWIVTLDHDSISPENLLESLYNYTGEGIAIVAPNIIYKNNEQFTEQSKQGIEKVQWVITSASLTNLEIWEEIGGFDEKLFIDGVDRDYGIRANRAGYTVLKNYDVNILHELGDLNCLKCFGRTIYVTNHSPIRKYYMARNSVYLDYKLKTNEAPKYILKLMFKTLFYENDKFKKTSSIVKGIIDGRKLRSR